MERHWEVRISTDLNWSNNCRYQESVSLDGFKGRSRALRILGYHNPLESHYEAIVPFIIPHLIPHLIPQYHNNTIPQCYNPQESHYEAILTMFSSSFSILTPGSNMGRLSGNQPNPMAAWPRHQHMFCSNRSGLIHRLMSRPFKTARRTSLPCSTTTTSWLLLGGQMLCGARKPSSTTPFGGRHRWTERILNLT